MHGITRLCEIQSCSDAAMQRCRAVVTAQAVSRLLNELTELDAMSCSTPDRCCPGTAGLPRENNVTHCPDNGTSCYFMYSVGRSYQAAKASCALNRGGDLVSWNTGGAPAAGAAVGALLQQLRAALETLHWLRSELRSTVIVDCQQAIAAAPSVLCTAMYSHGLHSWILCDAIRWCTCMWCSAACCVVRMHGW
jgi:hypothetical protein